MKPLIDLEWQERGWGELDLPEKYVGFDEIVMGFMDDCEPILERYAEYGFTQEQQTSLQKLYDMVDKYDSSLERPEDEKEIIKDSEWHKIRDFAKSCLRCFEAY